MRPAHLVTAWFQIDPDRAREHLDRRAPQLVAAHLASGAPEVGPVEPHPEVAEMVEWAESGVDPLRRLGDALRHVLDLDPPPLSSGNGQGHEPAATLDSEWDMSPGELARTIRPRRDWLVGRCREVLGPIMADRLQMGLERALAALESTDEPVDSLTTRALLGPDGGWALAVAVRSLGLEGPLVERVVVQERAARVSSRSSAPLPQARARRLQMTGRLRPDQVRTLYELFALDRQSNAMIGPHIRGLIEDCLALATQLPAAGGESLPEPVATLDAGMVILDPALRPIVQREHARQLLARSERPRNMAVICGPASTGKRRFAEVAAAALGRPLYRVRASALGEDLHDAVLGSAAFEVPGTRGLFVDARLETGCSDPVVHIDGLESLGAERAEMLAALLTDTIAEPHRMLRGRYAPAEFEVDPTAAFVIVSSNDPGSVPAVLADFGSLVELSPPSPPQRREIVDRFIVPELLVAHGLGSDAAPRRSTVDELVRRHVARTGMRELADDLRTLIAHRMLQPDGDDEAAGLDLLPDGPAVPARRSSPGSLHVPVLIDRTAVMVRVDVAPIPGAEGVLLPEFLTRRTTELVREAIEHVRVERPLGILVPSGLSVSLNVQAAVDDVHAPWLSTIAAVAACSLAAGRTIGSGQGVLAVMTRSGMLEPIEVDQVDPLALIASAGWTDIWLAEGSVGTDAAGRIALVHDFCELLVALGFEKSSSVLPPGYL